MQVSLFASRLKEIYGGLKDGYGLAFIRCLPIQELDLMDVAIVYWAMELHMGQATPNNPEGDMFGHITDLGKTEKNLIAVVIKLERRWTTIAINQTSLVSSTFALPCLVAYRV
jgi:hypothetical protein